ncbi:hypothetical protein B7463_g11613, partial [Scytalidium lignicola]
MKANQRFIQLIHSSTSGAAVRMSQQQNAEQGAVHIFAAEFDSSLSPWNRPAQEYLRMTNELFTKVDGLATGNIVFNEEGKVLVIQRATSDSMPNRWEIPGGGVDDEDLTVLEGAARELWEEAGLVAKRFKHVVTEGPDQKPGQVYPNSTHTKTWYRFTFDVQVKSCEHVKLDPKEHQAFVWATEDEIRDQLIGDRQHPITNKYMQALILEAFRLRKEAGETGETAPGGKESVSEYVAKY